MRPDIPMPREALKDSQPLRGKLADLRDWTCVEIEHTQGLKCTQCSNKASNYIFSNGDAFILCPKHAQYMANSDYRHRRKSANAEFEEKMFSGVPALREVAVKNLEEQAKSLAKIAQNVFGDAAEGSGTVDFKGFKTPFELIDMDFVADMAENFSAGIKDDRTPNDWKEIEWSEQIFDMYCAKILRHLHELKKSYGEAEDREVLVEHHTAAIACNANIINHHETKK